MGRKRVSEPQTASTQTPDHGTGEAESGRDVALHPSLREGEVGSNELKTVSTQEMIRDLAKAGAPPDVVKEYLSMIREEREQLAKEGLIKAIAAFQKACPTIKKTKIAGKPGQVRYLFADLGAIKAQIPPLDEYGLSYGFTQIPTEKGVKVKCTVRHIMGGETHGESPTFPIDEALYMNDSQKTSSANSYARRSALSDALGLIFEDEDDDAQSLGGGLSAEDLYARFRNYTHLLWEHYDSLKAIKEDLALDKIEEAREAWAELSQDDQIGLWTAPSKGGILTTEERAKLKFGEKWQEQLQRKK